MKITLLALFAMLGVAVSTPATARTVAECRRAGVWWRNIRHYPTFVGNGTGQLMLEMRDSLNTAAAGVNAHLPWQLHIDSRPEVVNFCKFAAQN